MPRKRQETLPLSGTVFTQLPKPKKRGRLGELEIVGGSLFLDGELLLEKPEIMILNSNEILWRGFQPIENSRGGVPQFMYQEIIVRL